MQKYWKKHSLPPIPWVKVFLDNLEMHKIKAFLKERDIPTSLYCTTVQVQLSNSVITYRYFVKNSSIADWDCPFQYCLYSQILQRWQWGKKGIVTKLLGGWLTLLCQLPFLANCCFKNLACSTWMKITEIGGACQKRVTTNKNSPLSLHSINNI